VAQTFVRRLPLEFSIIGKAFVTSPIWWRMSRLVLQPWISTNSPEGRVAVGVEVDIEVVVGVKVDVEVGVKVVVTVSIEVFDGVWTKVGEGE
jgi:hypothetical protein